MNERLSGALAKAPSAINSAEARWGTAHGAPGARAVRKGLAMLAMLAAATGGPAAAYSVEDLQRDARAHHAKMMARLGAVRIVQVATFAAPGGAASDSRSEVWLKGEKWRVEGALSMGGGSAPMQSTTLFDGKELWTLTMGMKVKLPAGQGQAPWTSAWSSLPEGTRLVGSETFSGRACWMLEYPQAPANPVIRGAGRTRVCIDKVQFILLMSESVLSGKTIRTTMSDFRTVKGLDFPHATTTTSNGQTTMSSKVTRLDVGADMPDHLFDASKLGGSPAGAAGGAPAGPGMEALMRQAEEMRRRFGGQAAPPAGK
ncbi:MAG: hypothetical protein JNL30_17670 [Rubrivivax sp.]|nr:hypothetical protein [Rubrivivax sp.]